MKKDLTVVISVGVICLTILGISWNVRNTGISIRNTGSNSESIQNSISVSGEGKITATPDIVRINAGISEIAKTTKAAQEAANKKLNTILDILKKYDIPNKNIQTNNLSIRPEYEWKGDKGRQLIGQKVSQTLTIKISDIDKDSEKVGKIIDTLGAINGLELNSVNFDIEDKKEFFSKAREQAFEKAQQKAAEYAKFGKVTLLKPISISDASISYNPPVFSNYAKMDMMAENAVGSSLPAGQLEITATVNVVFGIK